MPNYDFTCQKCQKQFLIFLKYDEFNHKLVDCPCCGSSKVTKRITRVRIARSGDSRFDNLDDFSTPEGLAQMEENPQALGRVMRKMSGELGGEMQPEFNEVVDRLEKGQTPDEIESDLSDYARKGGFSPGDDTSLE